MSNDIYVLFGGSGILLTLWYVLVLFLLPIYVAKISANTKGIRSELRKLNKTLISNQTKQVAPMLEKVDPKSTLSMPIKNINYPETT